MPMDRIRSCLNFMHIPIPRYPSKTILQDLMIQNFDKLLDQLNYPVENPSTQTRVYTRSTEKEKIIHTEIFPNLVVDLFWNTGRRVNLQWTNCILTIRDMRKEYHIAQWISRQDRHNHTRWDPGDIADFLRNSREAGLMKNFFEHLGAVEWEIMNSSLESERQSHGPSLYDFFQGSLEAPRESAVDFLEFLSIPEFFTEDSEVSLTLPACCW
jgi:hypothetical protein